MFLHIIGHNVRFRVIGSRYYRSIETVHHYFRSVLRAILTLYKKLIVLPDSELTPHEIISNPRFYPYFKDCLGAIDGTHIRASVPLDVQGRFRGRKGGTTQNVFAAVTFDLRFCYVLARWEGSAHDSRVLNDALTRPNRFKIPEGKYYLGDAGYGIRNGILTPYRGVRYHLKEFSGHRPENKKELFNLRHSSLRTTIERVFGILKKRFRVLDAEPFWDFMIQVDIVLACCIIHNHIMGIDPNDEINQALVDDDGSLLTLSHTQSEERHEARQWNAKRDEIAEQMWNDFSI
ncbi:protein ALP1-like [Ipomoea triloba]|uniref:protein ALP1-like n=1 Tax=Ipomoea triloba TaxID=35885 RepID=UPI00125D60C4|nr:protein ALP1-like [Ipomoea triloba]